MFAKQQVEYYQGADGEPLQLLHWRPLAEAPWVRIVALHGIQSHAAWYGYSSERLATAGAEVFFLDRRGSGMNQSRRGHTPDLETLVEDVRRFLVDRRRESAPLRPGAELVLMGISWGGKLATEVAVRAPHLVDRLVLLSPGLCAHVRARWWQTLPLVLAHRLCLGNRRVPIPLRDPELFTSQPLWQDFIRNDPLALHKVTVSFLMANRELDQSLQRAAGRVACPLLALLSGNDRIIDNDATRARVRALASGNHQVLVYPGASHTLEFEPDRDRIVDDLIAWLRSGPDRNAEGNSVA
ncbi:MAG: alpha/beta fold hydrolase [Planctomycetales bacterium]